ncbi:MAG TPA: heavy metal translocating P-type ATPase [Clostridia bacterium]|nr:heavy metal translocating P-type ATPase [Clostridia bacterium]
MNEKTFRLNGLTCADCALKIENEIKNMEGISSAELNFAVQKLDIAYDPGFNEDLLISRVKKAVSDIEPGVEVTNAVEEADSPGISEQNTRLAKRRRLNVYGLAAGAALFAAGLAAGDALSLPLFLLSWFAAGFPVLRQAIVNILKGRIFDENFLMTIATIGAFATGQYPEAAAVMLFYKIGMLLEDRAVNNSRKSIAALMDLKPEFASLKTGNSFTRVSPEKIKAGDILQVKPGERIPVDSIITEGESLVDTSSLTGESLPGMYGPGQQVYGGAINKTALLTLQAVNTLKESAVTRILALVEDAASKKAPIESFISRFAVYYTPAVTLAALLTAILPPLITGSLDFGTWLYKAMIFLVISCPCALVVSIPLTFFAGIGKASSIGILIKGGNYLEALNKVDTMVFDKTGTLTEGIFSVSGIKAVGCTEEQLLEYAAYAESGSNHPIAVSIVKAYGKHIDGSRITSCSETAGKGVEALLSGETVIAGNAGFLQSRGADPGSEGIGYPGGTSVHIAVDGCYKGLISVSDKLKKDSLKAVEELRKSGLKKLILLTGDTKGAAEDIAERLRLDEVHYSLLPHQKVEWFERIKASAAGRTAFTGDGINDAPVLAAADIGISMGGLGSDAAIEASDIVLMTDEPSKLAVALKLAHLTRKIAFQNIFFALGIKLLIILLSTFGIATMWEAVFADVGVTLLAVLNTFRIRYSKL